MSRFILIFGLSTLVLPSFVYSAPQYTTAQNLDVFLMKNLIITELNNVNWGTPESRENYASENVEHYLRYANHSKLTTSDLLNANLILLKADPPNKEYSKRMREFAEGSNQSYVYVTSITSIFSRLNPFKKRIVYDSHEVISGRQTLPATSTHRGEQEVLMKSADNVDYWEPVCSADYLFCGHGGYVMDEETCEASAECTVTTDRDLFEENLERFKEFVGKVWGSLCNFFGQKCDQGRWKPTDSATGVRS
jgi:hypothetical protein